MIAKRSFLFRALLGITCLCWMEGCAPTHIVMDVESRAAPSFPAPACKKFSFLSPEGEMPLTENLLPIIRGELEKKGLVHDRAKPHVLVLIKAGTRAEQRQEPVVSRPVPSLQPTPKGATMEMHYVIEGGGFYTVHIRWISMDVFDSAGRKPGDELWQGKVASEGEEDLDSVAKCLISGLLADYPAGPGKTRKILKLNECK
ncbi:MAG: DUF4136 domain-containing protein [Smithellaceae bacterium]|jgi:hypothetical protein|nr:DUF4136 domain-containing protein [Smithellaceae bacterium]MDD3259968.1 DUF4136 domain-containing protein [Smithellaceae bacterium]MDD3849207.1 DUF4136 domain-containing protein [Smithellaceae bacterium]HOG13063.1 DUF4136 domain-containing protein [Smithellaceae bacterium]HOQ72245.1 DUF4136 domain-containing protein [Smithellaceae bacterium]